MGKVELITKSIWECLIFRHSFYNEGTQLLDRTLDKKKGGFFNPPSLDKTQKNLF